MSLNVLGVLNPLRRCVMTNDIEMRLSKFRLHIDVRAAELYPLFFSDLHFICMIRIIQIYLKVFINDFLYKMIYNEINNKTNKSISGCFFFSESL